MIRIEVRPIECEHSTRRCTPHFCDDPRFKNKPSAQSCQAQQPNSPSHDPHGKFLQQLVANRLPCFRERSDAGRPTDGRLRRISPAAERFARGRLIERGADGQFKRRGLPSCPAAVIPGAQRLRPGRVEMRHSPGRAGNRDVVARERPLSAPMGGVIPFT